MGRTRDEDTGKYKQTHSDADILELLSDRRLSTRELAEELEYHRSTVLNRLEKLEAENEVTSTPVGQTRLWERVDT